MKPIAFAARLPSGPGHWDILSQHVSQHKLNSLQQKQPMVKERVVLGNQYISISLSPYHFKALVC